MIILSSIRSASYTGWSFCVSKCLYGLITASDESKNSPILAQNLSIRI